MMLATYLEIIDVKNGNFNETELEITHIPSFRICPIIEFHFITPDIPIPLECLL